MRIAVTGANGQLGQALCRRLEHHDIIPLNQGDFELDTPHAIEQVIATQANLVIHPAAYTHVDGCAQDPDYAYRINGVGTKYVALACQRLAIPLVYISTNEIFPGTGTMPYTEYEPAHPINAYGASKWYGEQVVRELLNQFYIVRVSWLFGGERNFVRTILRLLQEPPAEGLRVVTDEIGNPTYAPDAADAIARLIEQPMYGTYHFVNSGWCSRYEFTQEIARLAGYADSNIAPIVLADYQRASTPPPYTPLSNTAGAAIGIVFRPWQEALAEYIQMLKNQT